MSNPVSLLELPDSGRRIQDSGAVKSEGVLANAGRSLAYYGVQSPLDGVTQLAGKIVGEEHVPELKLIKPPEQAEFGTKDWHAQQIGAAVGVALDFVAMHKLIGAGGRTSFARQATRVARDYAPASMLAGGRYAHISSAAATGAIYEGIFRPVQDGEGSFAGARLRHAAEGALTFAALSGTSRYLKNGALANVGNRSLRRIAASDVTTTALAGIPVGAGRAQLSSLAAGEGFASADQTLKTSYEFLLVGAAVGGINTAGRRVVESLGSGNRLQGRDLNILIIEDARAFRAPIVKELQMNGLGKVTRLSGVEKIGPQSDHILGVKPGKNAEPLADSYKGNKARLQDIKPREYDVALVDGDFVGSLRSGTRIIPELKLDGIPLVIAISGGGAGNKPLLRSGADIGVPKELVKPLVHEGKLDLRALVENPDLIPRARKLLPPEVEALRQRQRAGEDFGSFQMDV